MKKVSRKLKLFVSVAMLVALIIATVLIVRANHSSKCHDIVGDGYAMGTDPKPVVIGNTCDL
jgi:hypothetical protein